MVISGFDIACLEIIIFLSPVLYFAWNVQKYDGYPSGLMVDFACDAYGTLILAVSSLAVHTALRFSYTYQH